ncbi:MurR/RpiR family transcriptional regulator [Alcaligenaceae bacterium]|nr:MurR/RpiR family transcriptional regulator [Alcaligenaceae bacterium]
MNVPSIRAQIAAALSQLTPTQLRLADYVTNNLLSAATMRIEEFAKANQVSSATANRFARTLGFAGYPAFRASLMQEYEVLISPSERLRQAQSEGECSNQSLITTALQADAANLHQTVQNLPTQVCEQAITALCHAKRVFILGYGSSAYLAGQLEYGLSPYRKAVQSLASVGGTVDAARRLFDANEDDLIVAIAFPRYIADTLTLARLAHEQGAKILALTDGPTSPLVAFSDINMYLQTGRQFAANSDAVVLSVIQALCGAVAFHNPHAVATSKSMTQATTPWLLHPQQTTGESS